MAQAFGRYITHQQVMDAVNVYIAELLEEPPADSIYSYNPGMRCYEVTYGASITGMKVWNIFIDKAFPEDDGLRLNICEYLEGKFGVGANVVLEW